MTNSNDAENNEPSWLDEDDKTTSKTNKTIDEITTAPEDFFPMPIYTDDELKSLSPMEKTRLVLASEIREILWAMKEKRATASYKDLSVEFSDLLEKYIVLLGGSTQRMEVSVINEEQRSRIAGILSENSEDNIIDIP